MKSITLRYEDHQGVVREKTFKSEEAMQRFILISGDSIRVRGYSTAVRSK